MIDQQYEKLFFIVRTDVSADSGQQRVFGAYDDEASAAAAGAFISSSHPGKFKVFEGAAVLSLEREIGPVKAVPVSSN